MGSTYLNELKEFERAGDYWYDRRFVYRGHTVTQIGRTEYDIEYHFIVKGCFDQKLFMRWTTDNWATHHDTYGSYVDNEIMPLGTDPANKIIKPYTESWSIKISVPSYVGIKFVFGLIVPGKRWINFLDEFDSKQYIFWDNNYQRNYSMQLPTKQPDDFFRFYKCICLEDPFLY